MEETREKKIKNPIYFGIVILVLLLGAFLRIKVYLINRSLWVDEAALANNMLLPHSILDNMEYSQAAPPLFKLIEIINMHLFGISEYVLRLFPLTCGLASLALFALIIEKVIEKPWSKIFANFLFAINYFLIYYSSEVKQYSSDVFVTLLVIAIFLYIDIKKITKKQLIILGCFFSFCFWLSHASMFILAGVFAVALFIFHKEIKKWFLLILPSIVSFIPFYFLHLKTVSNSTFMQVYWSDYFLTSVQNAEKIASSYFSCLIYPSFMNIFLGILIITGIILLLKENKYRFGIITTPLIIIIAASMIHKYPIAYRLCLFTMPIFLIYLAKPLDIISKKKIPHTILLIFLFITAFFPYFRIYPQIIMNKNIWYREEMRPLLEIIKKEKGPLDKIYITQNAHHAFNFYNRFYRFDKKDVILAPYSQISPKLYKKPLESSLEKNNNYWIIFVQYSNKYEYTKILEKWLVQNTFIRQKYSFYESYLYYVKKN